MKKKAVLVVSFGTSYRETREKTIDKIEEKIREAYPECGFYCAWTSRMIIKKLKDRDGICVPGVREAMEQIRADGVEELYVQPTHVIPGIENDLMIQDAQAFSQDFQKLVFGAPLLTSTEDHFRFAEGLYKEYSRIPDTEAIVLMGHGTEHYVNTIYAALDFIFKDKGHRNIFVGTVEAYPDINYILRRLEENGYKRVHLVPSMIVAGDHASNDMAGPGEDSWKSILECAGHEVTCHLRGLGEYRFVQELFLEHLGRIME